MVKQSLAEAIKAQLAERSYVGPATIKVEGYADHWSADVIRTGASTGKLRTWSASGFTLKQAIGRALQCAVYWEATGKILLLPQLDRKRRNMETLATYLEASPNPPADLEALASATGIEYWDLREILAEAAKHG